MATRETMRAPVDVAVRLEARQQPKGTRLLADDLLEVGTALSGRRGAPRVVIWGFCSGGRLAYVAAARLRGLNGAVAYYGFLKAEPPRAAPLDIVGEIKVPLLGVFGGADQGIPADQIAEFERSLERAGKDFAIKTYPGAPHGFLRYGAAEHADAIADALKRTFAFFARTL